MLLLTVRYGKSNVGLIYVSAPCQCLMLRDGVRSGVGCIFFWPVFKKRNASNLSMSYDTCKPSPGAERLLSHCYNSLYDQYSLFDRSAPSVLPSGGTM